MLPAVAQHAVCLTPWEYLRHEARKVGLFCLHFARLAARALDWETKSETLLVKSVSWAQPWLPSRDSKQVRHHRITITSQSGFPLVAFFIQLTLVKEKKNLIGEACFILQNHPPSKAAGGHKATSLLVGLIGHDAPARRDANGECL
jgi:hypothetical protein